MLGNCFFGSIGEIQWTFTEILLKKDTANVVYILKNKNFEARKKF